MAVKTYSFQEVSLTLSHPDVGRLFITGAGAGSVRIAMAADRTAKEVASDGVVVLSKIRDRSGSLNITVFNTSDFHAELKKWYNRLEQAATNAWATMSATITNTSTGEQTKCTGVAFVKLPDIEYETTAKLVDWGFVVADVQQEVI